MHQSVCKGTIFSPDYSLNCRGKLLHFPTPHIMGILNITDDSFYDGGSYSTEKQIIERTEIILEEGASMIDIGAVSTRPGAKLLPVNEEINAIVPAVRAIRKHFPQAIISVDTCWAEVAKAVVLEGADMINDISGGQFDEDMFLTIKTLQIPYILMHTQGIPQKMQKKPQYKNVVDDLILFFSERLNKLEALGVKDIILDPGFGFGKTIEHNYELMSRLDEFSLFNNPILVGISRKSMIYKVLNGNPDTALTGTTVLHTIALLKGAKILRVHDVKEAVECLKITSLLQKAGISAKHEY